MFFFGIYKIYCKFTVKSRKKSAKVGKSRKKSEPVPCKSHIFAPFFQTRKTNIPMNKISTSVIIGIVCVVLLALLVYLNRDKFGTKKAPADAPADDTPAED